MNVLKKVVLTVLILSFTVFVALFGRLPALRKTPIGLLHRTFWITLPALCRKADRWLTGGRMFPSLLRLGNYLMDENHPLVLIFFLVVLAGSQALFIPAAFPRLERIPQISVITLSAIPYFFAYKSVKTKSSYITPGNLHLEMRRYPYDHVLYHPGQICRTCHFQKPARSKHCSICKACVAKQDHHCIWIMNCVGKDNYVYFLGLVGSLGALLSYGAFIAYRLLDEVLQATTTNRLETSNSGVHWSSGLNWSEYGQSWLWAFAEHIQIGGVGLLALWTAPLAWGLFLYHVYLVWAGMTTNESSKWADWRDDIADGLAFKAIPNGDHRNADIEPTVNWPISSNQQLVRTENGKAPEDAHIANGQSKPRPKWIRVRGLAEVENLYDLGFWDNLADILPTR